MTPVMTVRLPALHRGSQDTVPVFMICTATQPFTLVAASVRAGSVTAGPTQAQAGVTVCSSMQDPAQADKLTKIQRDLDETKVILHKTIESMLERGEKLDSLVDKSSDLSMASQMFYKQARKTNSCCKMM